MTEKPQAHRPGLFKLPNKKHKTGQHRSKGALARDTKGKLGVKVKSLKQGRVLSKAERKNKLQQIRAYKTDQLQEKQRLQGGLDRAPYLTTVISFDENTPSSEIIAKFLNADPDASSMSKNEWGGSVNLSCSRFKSRYCFVAPNQTSVDAVLNSAKISDVLMFLWPLSDEISEDSELLMSMLLAQGLPTALHMIQGLPANGKQRDGLRKSLTKSMEKWGMAEEKLHNLDTPADAIQLLRSISVIRKNSTVLLQRHAHLLVDRLSFDDIQGDNCTLKISGFVRGPPLDLSKMVHIQGWGDFPISKCDIQQSSRHPSISVLTKQKLSNDGDLSTNQDDVDMDASDDDEEDEEIEDGDESEPEQAMSVSNFGDEDTIDADENSAVDMEEVEKYRKQRENKKWPDEVDTPNDVSARERFQKYRGLKSFRTSPWDSKENLPSEYGKISKFSNFKRTKKIVLNEIEKSFEKNENGEINVVLPGSFVTLHISCVPVAMQGKLQKENPLVVFSLLAHEEKMTVMNLLLHKHLSCLVPVNNKDNLIFQVGYRRFEAQPLFSEHNNGSKFKMHRFMPSEGTFCASVYAPVMFPPASVLVFRRDKKGRQRLVATGNVLDLNPDRIVLKRVVLSGHPYRVNKRLAVVRYMFFSKDDVHWFKPVEVYTPKGRRGHIKEPLGIHGLFKCVFDQPLNTQDSVLMNLYKRVFPKWTYNSRVNEFSIEGNRSRSDTVSTDVKMEE